MYLVLIGIGWMLSKTPELLVKGLVWILARLFYSIPSKRLHIIYSNLHHAFPDRSDQWLKKTVWRVCKRTVEMGLFTMASPHFTPKRMSQVFSVTEETNEEFRSIVKQGKPILGFTPHFSMIEAFNEWPNKIDIEYPKTAVMYRPHKNKRVDALIAKHRGRTGFEMVSRRTGVRRIGEVLKENGMAILLFDQNTRNFGSLIPFFGRVTSATELPGLMAQKYKAIPVAFSPHRTSFWRATTEVEVLNAEPNAASMTITANKWLENKLKESDEILVDWLWSHNRWRILHRPEERLGMVHKKSLINFDEFRERKTRFAMIHPSVFGKEDALLDFIQKLRKSRPDAEITVIADCGERLRNENPEWIDIGYNIPSDQKQALKFGRALRDSYLDLMMVLDDDALARKIAKETRIQQIFGVKLYRKKDRVLTNVWTPENVDSWQLNPKWIEFGKHFGMQVGDSDSENLEIENKTPEQQ